MLIYFDLFYTKPEDLVTEKCTDSSLSFHLVFPCRLIEAFALNNIFHGDSFDHHHQLRPLHLERTLFFIIMGSLKVAGLQSFMVNNQTIPFPMKKLDRTMLPVNEDENFSA